MIVISFQQSEVLFSTLYKFIVWTYWAKIQSYFGSKLELVPTTTFGVFWNLKDLKYGANE